MEIIFVSSDKTEGEFMEYFSEMPFLALPFSDRTTKAALSQALGVEGIPTLAVLKRDGTVVTTDGTSLVSSSPNDFPWPAKALSALDEVSGGLLGCHVA
jgi:hypothetical protein